MNKILIYRRESELSPTGGPKGYLYNLKNGLDKIDTSDLSISFLPPIKHIVASDKRFQIKKSLPSFVVKLFKSFQHGKYVYNIVHKKSKPIVNLEKYDCIHFHDTCSMYPLREYLRNYKGKIALTSHSPQPLHQEFIESATWIERKILHKTYAELYKMDEYAFNRADYIIYPTKYSDEPYINRWEPYLDFKKSNLEKFQYLLTGTIKPKIKNNRLEIRKKYGIPENAFVISYVGRHNIIKGYNNLITYCEKLCSDNIYILVAGNKGNILPPQNRHWIEIGWTNDPYSIMNASDVFVLPNLETYFDLVLLEVLAIGTIPLISNTGGNKFFASEQYPGVFIYNNEKDFDNKLNYIMNLTEKEKLCLNEKNRSIYEKYFTIDVFASEYVKLVSNLLK